MKSKYFVTTPIYYVNDTPHIGHACTTVAADVLARSARLLGKEVLFLTGTDEHGQKIAQEAASRGLKPKEFCDQIAPQFEENWKKLNISYDYFIRTTDPNHEKVVQDLILKIRDNGYIYEDTYKGWYCVGCEAFKTQDELVDGKCPEHQNKTLEWYEEKNYFLALRKIISENQEFFDKLSFSLPDTKRREMLGKIRGLESDVSISRSKVDWGIPIPWDSSQTIYVWFDALINYYSATRIKESWADFWPADMHLVGKGINWFHSVIWPAMLLAAKLPTPEAVFAHSHYNTNGQKMSKSLGNVIAPFEIVDKYGVDAARFLIAKTFPENDDSDITKERLSEIYNSDLANNLGNLVARLTKLAEGLEIDLSSFQKFDSEVQGLIFKLSLPQAIWKIYETKINPLNVFLNDQKPWTLDPADPKRHKILRHALGELFSACWQLQPFMPSIYQEIYARLATGRVIFVATPLFPRIND